MRACLLGHSDTLISDSNAGESSVTAIMKSPRVQEIARQIPLPPSPSVVANQIEAQTAKVRSQITKAYQHYGITEWIDNAREQVSTSASIESIAIIIELLGLHSTFLPTKQFAMIPAGKYNQAIPAKIPDLFALLEPAWWNTFLLWFTTSVVLPMTFAYFFNITLKATKTHSKRGSHASHATQQYDPLTFNIAKGLIMWLVYSKGVTFLSIPSLSTLATIENAVPGGHQGVMVACAVGAVTAISEAILKK
jgi:hypothetical protein